jgi:predicted metal-dependent hydrolase
MPDAPFRDFLDFEIPSLPGRRRAAPTALPLTPPLVQNEPTEIIVRRSTKRKRTVSAFREGQAIVVAIPARMSKRDEAQLVPEMVAKVESAERKLRPGDGQLQTRAEKLSRELFAGQARPSSVRWSANMASRWGSCTLDDASIRISSRVQGMPKYVLDYVLVHELTHLLEAGHSERFYDFERRFPRSERAIGFLEGWQSGKGGITDLSDI